MRSVLNNEKNTSWEPTVPICSGNFQYTLLYVFQPGTCLDTNKKIGGHLQQNKFIFRCSEYQTGFSEGFENPAHTKHRDTENCYVSWDAAEFSLCLCSLRNQVSTKDTFFCWSIKRGSFKVRNCSSAALLAIRRATMFWVSASLLHAARKRTGYPSFFMKGSKIGVLYRCGRAPSLVQRRSGIHWFLHFLSCCVLYCWSIN